MTKIKKIIAPTPFPEVKNLSNVFLNILPA